MTTVVERPGEARGAEYYDAHYREETAKPYRAYMMWPVWRQVVEFIPPGSSPAVLELGCGTGGLAHYLRDRGFTDYRGFDFSVEAVQRARRRVPGATFEVADLTTYPWHELAYDTLVAVEFLEHVERDRELLARARPGTRVLFSVPNLNCAGHVRWFGGPRQVADHYKGVLTMQKVEVFSRETAKWFVCHAVRDAV